MSRMVLLNRVGVFRAGQAFDTVLDALAITAAEELGGRLVPDSPAVEAAVAKANATTARGDGDTASAVMIAQLMQVGVPTPYFIFVSQPSDLPAAVGGVRTLADGVTYYFTTHVDLNGDRLVCGDNTTILGASSENCSIRSTGLVGQPLISSVYSLPLRNIAIVSPTAPALLLDASASPPGRALDWDGVNFVDTPQVGTIRGYSNFIAETCALLNSAGLVFDGTIGTIGFSQCLFDASPGGTVITVPATAVVGRRFRIIYSAFIVLAGETGIAFDAGATVQPESYILDTVNFSGGGAYTAGVLYTDNKVRWVSCVGVENSVAAINMVVLNNAVATSIPLALTEYRVSGVSQIGPNFQRFTHDAVNNTVVYASSVPRRCKVQCSFTLLAPNNNVIGFYIAVARAGQPLNPPVDVIAESETYVTASGTRPDSSFVQAIVDLRQGDQVYVAVENRTGANAVTVSFYNLVAEQAVSSGRPGRGVSFGHERNRTAGLRRALP